MLQTRTLPLLTVRLISRLTGQPVSEIRHCLDENPDILPAAVADDAEVYDRDTFLRLISLMRQQGGVG